MKVKHTTWLAILAMVFIVFGCGAVESEAPAEAPEEPGQPFTLDELKQHNGEDGQRAYIAVDGIVYDVTDVPQWSSGSHGGFQAGTEVTEALENAPHGADLLDRAEVVGVLIDE